MSDVTYGGGPESPREQPHYSRAQFGRPVSGPSPYAQAESAESAERRAGTPALCAAAGLPSPDQTRKYALVVAGAVIAVVLVVGLINWASGRDVRDQGRYTVATPDTVGTYSSVEDATTASARIRWERNLSGRFLLKSGQQAKVRFYRSSDSPAPAFGLIAYDKENSKYPGYNPKVALKRAFRDAKVAHGTTESAGPLGGLLQCGQAAGSTGAVCAWADGSSLAAVVFLDASSLREAAVTTLALRNALEH